jgi:hypothetical protein
VCAAQVASAQERPSTAHDHGEGHRAAEASGRASALEHLADTIRVASVPQTPSPRPSSADFIRPVWNVWAEEGTAGLRFTPAEYLQPRRTYQLVVDLGAMSYSRTGFGGDAEASPAFGQWLDNQLAQAGAATVSVTVVLLPSSDTFVLSKTIARQLTINLNKMREVARGRVALPGDAFAALRRGQGEVAFSFGRAIFDLTTRDVETATEGSLTLAIWANGKPVDDFTIRACLSRDSTAQCTSRPSVSFSGTDSYRFAAARSPVPDAAFHFLEMDRFTGGIVGVFHENTCADCPYVRFDVSPDSLRDFRQVLASTIIPAFQESTTDEHLLTTGGALYNLLLPPDQVEARAAFERFVTSSGPSPSPGAADARSIFVRVLDPSSDPLLLPFGLVAVGDQFLGFRFRIEQPLAIQNYLPSSQCVSSWYVAAPPDEVNRSSGLRWPTLLDKAVQPFPTIEELAKWMGTVDQNPTSDAAVVLFGHHASNALYYSTPGARLTSAGLRRRFSLPAIAVLNACGSGGPGASGYVTALNGLGIPAIIATSAEVSTTMASDFMECLTNIVDSRRDGQPISTAYFGAVSCLREQYGARALMYMMLGNGSLGICEPGAKPK